MRTRDARARMLKRAGVPPVLTFQIPLEFGTEDGDGIQEWLAVRVRQSRRVVHRGRWWDSKVIHEGPPMVVQMFPRPRRSAADLARLFSAPQE